MRGKEVYTLLCHTTNHEHIKFHVWDMCGQDKVGKLMDLYYKNDGVIIMFDVTSRITYRNVEQELYKDLHRYFKECFGEEVGKEAMKTFPVVLVGNKIDVHPDEHKVHPKMICFHKGKFMNNYDVSVKEATNLENPLLWIAQKMFHDNQLEFDDMPKPHLLLNLPKSMGEEMDLS